MRFPALSDLDREQRRIYGEAPGDGAILVVGPPGTGKTVMAFHRAQKVKALGQAPKVIMFSKVLRRYTSSRSDVAPDVPVKTMHQWVSSWFQSGARKRVPKANGDRWAIDWPKVCADSIEVLQSGGGKALGWGHLLVDEGQDFPPEMYLALGVLQGQLASRNIATQVTIFADDNQRLQATKNSRIVDIRNNLFIADKAARNYVLRKNFRNTLPIAKFSAHYQVGNTSGMAELPDTEGELPQVVFAPNDREIADFIARKAKMNPGKQVGVIVNGYSKNVKRAYNQIRSRLPEGKDAPRLQMYLSGDDTHHDKQLDFDSGNTITVLHAQSAKGLEFDLVFFLGMEGMNLDSSGFFNERMTLYVMCSRARSELYIVLNDIDPSAPLPPSSVLLPRPSRKLCRYVGLGALASAVDKFQERLDKNEEPGQEEPQ